MTVGPLEPLGHCQKVVSLSILYKYYFGECLSELAELVPVPFSQRKSTRCSDRVHDFSVSIPRQHNDAYVKISFLAQLDSCL